MKENKYTMVLDTETLGLETRLIYDLGFIVVDQDLQVVEKKHMLVREVFKNRLLFMTAYYKNKRPEYIARKIKAKRYKKVNKELKKTLKKYNIIDIYAFNSPFDKSAIAFTNAMFRQNQLYDVRFIDIRKLAEKITKSQDYIAYCEKYGFLTPRVKRPKTTAETVYSYITNDPHFKESHISLDDCEIELEILRKVI